MKTCYSSAGSAKPHNLCFIVHMCIHKLTPKNSWKTGINTFIIQNLKFIHIFFTIPVFHEFIEDPPISMHGFQKTLQHITFLFQFHFLHFELSPNIPLSPKQRNTEQQQNPHF